MDKIRFFLIFLIIISLAFNSAKAQCGDREGDWTVGSEIICSNEIIYLDGNLLINGTGNLTFINVTLIINTGEYPYRIENNGSFYVKNNSVITREGGDPYNFSSTSGSKLEFYDSKIEKIGSFEIKTNNTKLKNITISNISENIIFEGSGIKIEGGLINSENPVSLNLNINSSEIIRNVFYGVDMNVKGNENKILSNNISETSNALRIEGANNNVSENIINSCFKGIFVYGSENYLLSNKITSTNHTIYVEGENNDISGNSLSSNQNGINATGNSNKINSNVISGGNYGLKIEGNYIEIKNNIITDSSQGMLLDVYSSRYIINNTIKNCEFYAIALKGMDNNITNGTIKNTQGMYIEGDRNTIKNVYFFNNTYGVYLKSSEGTNIFDSLFNLSKNYDIYILSSQFPQMSNANYSKLRSNWFLNLKVMSHSNVIENASVLIKDASDNIVFSGNTSGDGRIPTQIIGEFENISGVYKKLNPYQINVTKEGFQTNITEVNITQDTDIIINLETGISQNIPFLLDLVSPEDNKIYLRKDLINNALIPFSVESNMNITSCGFLLIPPSPNASVSGNLENATAMPSKEFIKYFNFSEYQRGIFTLLINCSDQYNRKNSTYVRFSVYPTYDCFTDENCSSIQKCSESYQCINLDCGCGYPENHRCVYYECCNDSMCDETKKCDITTHSCVNVTCPCGYIQNHYCHPYECCIDLDCGPTQICIANKCVNRTLYIMVLDEEIFTGKNVTIMVKDQDNNPVPNTRLTVIYKSGKSEEYVTDTNGFAYIVIKEAGIVQIKAMKERYAATVVLKKAEEGFNWLLVVVIGVIVSIGIISVLFFKGYVKAKDPVKLEKTVSDDVVMLRIKNNTKDVLRNLSVIDQVPRGSLIDWNVRPYIKMGSGGVDNLIWDILILEPKEEVVIEYRASSTTEGFAVRIGDKTYYSK